MKEFEPKSLLERNKDSLFASGIGSKRFWKRVGLIAAGIGVSLLLLSSIV